MEKQSQIHIKLGTLAMHEGLLTASEVNNIIIMQTHQDKKFGEIVVMVVQGSFTEADLSNIREQIEATLPMYWQPKRYVVIDKIPMTATGKIARSALQDIVEKM